MSREFKPGDSEETTDFKTREGLSDLRERASEFGSKVKEKASEFGSAVSETAERQRQNAAGGLGRLASTIHNKASAAPAGPSGEKFAHRLADGVESTASYLRDHNFKDMGDDLMSVCRKNPGKALLSALAFGFFVGLVARRK